VPGCAKAQAIQDSAPAHSDWREMLQQRPDIVSLQGSNVFHAADALGTEPARSPKAARFRPLAVSSRGRHDQFCRRRRVVLLRAAQISLARGIAQEKRASTSVAGELGDVYRRDGKKWTGAIAILNGVLPRAHGPHGGASCDTACTGRRPRWLVRGPN
jgi:hypothetical protein